MTQMFPTVIASQGLCCDFSLVPAEQRERALDEACDYRGDVTLNLKDGSQLVGYLFDRRASHPTAGGTVRIMLAENGEKRVVPTATIASLTFSGKDTAAGKTFENWVKRYIEKRLAGERASIESEALD